MSPWPRIAAVAVLIALPLAVSGPVLSGSRVLIPFDHRVFAPESLAVSDATLEDLNASANFDITEKTLVNAQEIRLARAEIARGRFPSWDPYARCGAPLFANVISGLAYPLNLPHLLMEPERAFAITAWINLAVAGLLMLGLLRQIGVGWRAALFGAVVFAWSGTLAARIHLYPHYTALLWLPGMLWAIECMRRRGGAAPVAGLALCTLMTWTAGYPPAALASTLTAGVWLALGWRHPRDGLRSGVRGAVGFAIGLGLAAYALAPMLAYFAETGRDTEQALVELRRTRYLDPAGWLNYLLEAPFSTPALNRAGGVPHHKAPLLWLLHGRAGEPGVEPLLKFTEHRVYPGALPFVLVPFALAWRPRRIGVVALLIVAALLLLATGGALFDRLCDVLAPVRFVQPMELMPPAACLLAVAAALGFDRLLAPDAGRLRWIAVGWAGALAAVSGLGAAVLYAASEVSVSEAFFSLLKARWGASYEAAGDVAVRAMFEPTLRPATALLIDSLLHGLVFFGAAGLCLAGVGRWPRAAPAAAIVLTAVELVWSALPLNRAHAPTPAGETSVHAFLREQRDAGADRGGFTVARVAAPRADGSVAPEVPLALPPNMLMAERIRDLNAYTFLDGRSHLPFARLYRGSAPPLLIRGRWFNAFPDDPRLGHALFDLFGVRYLLCHVGPGRVRPSHAGELAVAPLEAARGSFCVYERARPCPRAFVVPRAVVVEDEEAVIDAMVAADFAPRDYAVLTRRDRDELGRPLAEGDAERPGDVRFALDEGSHVMLEVRDSGGGFLVLADAFLSGWTATVNGVITPHVRADLCLRAVPIPPGDSIVDFRYRPPGLVLGAGLTVITMLLGSWWLLRGRLRPPVAASS